MVHSNIAMPKDVALPGCRSSGCSTLLSVSYDSTHTSPIETARDVTLL